MPALRARQKLDKYLIERRIAEGGFAGVYRALDTIEGVRVALKVPHPHLVDKAMLEDFRQEVRLAARLDHPNILTLKNASMIDGHFVIAFPLGEKTLDDRLSYRMSFRTALDFAEQLIDAVAYAHEQGVIHCDIKPENLILFPGNQLRLTDFGIAKVAYKTVPASGSGTLGYIAPEQAMGKPSFYSDVFSIGLILYRMLTGQLPEWPYDWPPPGFQKARKRFHAELITFLKRSLAVDPRKRYQDAVQMQSAFARLKPKALAYASLKRKKKNGTGNTRHWQTVRLDQFQRRFGRILETRLTCGRCQGPVSQYMQACPWCGTARKAIASEQSQFPAECTRCHRGMKLDWSYCPWCYGPGFEPHSKRKYSDARYEARCDNAACSRKLLMPFMRYCPWCQRKVRRKWKVPASSEKCSSCGWGVLREFWHYCPWCNKSLGR